jgi:hypothetical protein
MIGVMPVIQATLPSRQAKKPDGGVPFSLVN